MNQMLTEKRAEVLAALKPVMNAFGYGDGEYDYIVKDTLQTETLRIGDTYIGCSLDSLDAVMDEALSFLFLERVDRRVDYNTGKMIRTFWLSKEDCILNGFIEPDVESRGAGIADPTRRWEPEETGPDEPEPLPEEPAQGGEEGGDSL